MSAVPPAPTCPSVPQPPRATARLQFHPGFTLDAAVAVVPYLARLGISHVYASPLLAARSGSSHGYDVVDPTRINPELGGMPALRRLVAELRSHGMGLILDIVPNHMAASVENRWWRDVLEWGRDSPYSHFFDIDWAFPDPKLHGRVLVPTLGRPRNDLLAEGDIELQLASEAPDAEAASPHSQSWLDRIHVVTAGQRFPLAASAYALVLSAEESLADLAEQFAGSTSGSSFEAALAALHERAANDDGRKALDAALARYAPTSPEGLQRLDQLLASQPYLLAPWSQAWHRINWRRFFDVTDLIAIRPDRPGVFEAAHARVLQLYAEGLVDGLRIDHIDGLIDPAGYCRQLRENLRAVESLRPAEAPAGPAYLIVEKILAPGETLREDWDVDGTTGYEFMDQVGALLHDPDGAEPLKRFWQSLAGARTYAAHVLDARRQMTTENFEADLDATVRAVRALARQDDDADSGVKELREALVELIVHFPVYRTYADVTGADRVDTRVLEHAAAAARKSGAAFDKDAMALLLRWLSGDAPDDAQEEAARVITRFQRLTPPIAAKALEDTTFYRYAPLLSRNEVGAEPDHFALSVNDFHAACARRRRSTPHTLLATATHDHKRGEDARARLAVLSEMHVDWPAQVTSWRTLNAACRSRVGSTEAPDPVDEFILYQTLVGAWPLDLDATDADAVATFAARVGEWQRKALREAKRRSSWAEPNEAYESACQRFLDSCLSLHGGCDFLTGLANFVRLIAPAGALNGLTQTLLRLTTPGVPDLYQGSEFWDFSLVDPDNRRPVDYEARKDALSDPARPAVLLNGWTDGRIKQRLVACALAARSAQPDLFAHGSYRPLTLGGTCASRAIAFLRQHQDESVVVVATRLAWPLLGPEAMSPHVAPAHWKDSTVELPSGDWEDVLSGRVHRSQGSLALRTLLETFPAALLVKRAG